MGAEIDGFINAVTRFRSSYLSVENGYQDSNPSPWSGMVLKHINFSHYGINVLEE